MKAGELWPSAFCAFKDCPWEAAAGTEADLEAHLEEQHAEELEPIKEHLLRGDGPRALLSIYNQAVSCRCRQQAPVAGASLDRTALRGYANAMAEDRIQTLACFSCGGLHPYVEEVADKGEIQWRQPLRRAEPGDHLAFFGQPFAKIKGVLGLQAYLAKYNAVGQPHADGAPDIKLTDHESFDDWTLQLPGCADGALLCCPEDWAWPRPIVTFRARIDAATSAASKDRAALSASIAGCPCVKTAKPTLPLESCRRSATPMTCGPTMA